VELWAAVCSWELRLQFGCQKRWLVVDRPMYPASSLYGILSAIYEPAPRQSRKQIAGR
jgi:hypothetical protein